MPTLRKGDRLRAQILRYLIQKEKLTSGLPELQEIADALGVPVDQVSDQVDILDSLGAINANRTLGGGAAPMITGAGKALLEELEDRDQEEEESHGDKLEAAAVLQFEWDAFVSYASEDKEPFVKQLADQLAAEGVAVWYDEFALTVGDSLRRSIDKGLAKSRYGIVVLSPGFFAKEWPQKELDGLVARERGGEKVILPIWLDLGHSEVVAYSPTLADRVAAKASEGLDKVTAKLVRVLKPRAHMGGGNTKCRITIEQARLMGKTMSELVGLEYVVQGPSDVEAILRRAVRLVGREYSIPEIALMIGQFTVDGTPDGDAFILRGGPDVALFAEQLIHGERPHIPELD